MKGITVRTSRIFLYSLFSGFAHILTSGTLSDGNRKLGTGNMGFSKEFIQSNYIH